MLHTVRSYLPIQAQNAISFATGEVDWFNATTKSLGLTASVLAPLKGDKKSRYSLIKKTVKEGEILDQYLEKAKTEYGEEKVKKNKTNWSKEFEFYGRVLSGEYRDDVVYNLYDRNASNDIKAKWLKDKYDKLGEQDYIAFLKKYYTKIGELNNVISDDLHEKQGKLTGVTIKIPKKKFKY